MRLIIRLSMYAYKSSQNCRYKILKVIYDNVNNCLETSVSTINDVRYWKLINMPQKYREMQITLPILSFKSFHRDIHRIMEETTKYLHLSRNFIKE